ncbi:hypothetical protein CA54_27080 [Symmachiella macrocystis]|uniref:VWFA domain-containing protein n=1 Tax=Symmachiella macrocystis TaxID=2527985 RepID=A0A5C6BP84_9PLAN|nr:vWA domain-containing protein [Symmachiella macrocystis]TWU13868.1 hypothetical protein CA54_27080 [Symmachiella macrocystis]
MRQKREASALITSLAVHLFILAALFMVQYAVVQKIEEIDIQTVFEEQERQQPEFNSTLDAETEISNSLAAIAGGVATDAIGGNEVNNNARKSIEDTTKPKDTDFQANIPAPLPGFEEMGDQLEDGGEVNGETGAAVSGYPVAMSRMTDELRRLMREGKGLLVVWLFDESDSMQNDQKMIRDEFHKIYEELRIVEEQGKRAAKNQDAPILTAMHSFGKGITDLTKKPTSNENVIKAAINNIKVDKSGEENMSGAISYVIDKYSTIANRGNRRLILVIVSDESGDDGEAFDLTLVKAKKARAPCYILGRESIFGYPYARVRWKDSQFGLTHWLQIRRGPETAYPESLQYDGLHGRWDAQSAGFGPYEQVRLAKESGGIFFILPSEEENLVTTQHGEERKFRFEAIREYAPDLVSRNEYAQDRNESEFRRTIWDVIVKLNPHRDKDLYIREHWYQGDEEGFREEAKIYFGRALRAMGMLNEANKTLDSIKDLRDTETSQRWKANYDLAAAQVLAYRVRLFQYLLAMDQHAKNYPEPKNPKSNRWNLRRTKQMLPPDEEQVKITKVDMNELNNQLALATNRFRQVIFKHRGTPWAYRAKYEMDQGFGMEFFETFRDPRYDEVTVELPKQ